MQVVFDTSAVLASARSAVSPGELIMLVAEEFGGTVGVPVTCLAEAYAGAKGIEEDLLAYLATGAATVAVLPLAPIDVPEVGRLSRRASLGVAHAVVLTARFNSQIATLDGDVVRRLGVDDEEVIDL